MIEKTLVGKVVISITWTGSNWQITIGDEDCVQVVISTDIEPSVHQGGQ